VGRYEDDDLFTLTGERLGTLAYMSPEALTGDDQTWKSDQYALGISAFELLVGHRPFEERSLGAQIASKRGNPSSLVHVLSNRADRELCTVILTMISPKPGDRFGSYGELRTHLQKIFGDALELPDADHVYSESEPGLSD
jgi:serine/threonine-protein kinase